MKKKMGGGKKGRRSGEDCRRGRVGTRRVSLFECNDPRDRLSGGRRYGIIFWECRINIHEAKRGERSKDDAANGVCPCGEMTDRLRSK